MALRPSIANGSPTTDIATGCCSNTASRGPYRASVFLCHFPSGAAATCQGVRYSLPGSGPDRSFLRLPARRLAARSCSRCWRWSRGRYWGLTVPPLSMESSAGELRLCLAWFVGEQVKKGFLLPYPVCANYATHSPRSSRDHRSVLHARRADLEGPGANKFGVDGNRLSN
jgi:hypothetical protein